MPVLSPVFLLAAGGDTTVVFKLIFLPNEPIFSPAFSIFFFFDLGLELLGPLDERAETIVSCLSLRCISFSILSGEGFAGMSSGIRLMTLGQLSWSSLGVLNYEFPRVTLRSESSIVLRAFNPDAMLIWEVFIPLPLRLSSRLLLLTLSFSSLYFLVTMLLATLIWESRRWMLVPP